jgi:hypothetical protein
VTFNFPTPPAGHYYQIKHGVLSNLTDGPWRVVLMKKVLGFIPVEVTGALAAVLTQNEITKAADRARNGYFVKRALKDADYRRKNTNRVERRRNK